MILEIYVKLLHDYLEDKEQVNTDQLLEVRYEELVERPMDVLERVYKNFGYSGFQELEPVFQNYLDDSVTVMAEGYWVPYDSIPDYVFEIFTNLVHDSVEIKKKAYDVVCCHNTAVYQRVLAFFYPVDTARGCYEDMIIPMNLNITSEKSSTADEDYEAGIETMQIKPVDTSGNNLVLLKPVKRLIPVKTAAISIVWNKENESWKVKHLHLSLGLKRTRIYEMK